MIKPDSVILIIFGASGDLTARKLVPAMYHLYESGLTPEHFSILGVSRTPLTDVDFRKKVLKNVYKENNQESRARNEFDHHIQYLTLDTAEIKEYKRLTQKLNEITEQHKIPQNYIFYLSTPPSIFETIAKGLAAAGLNREGKHFKRLIIEKPFGIDLESSRKLNSAIHQCFKESQVYRIDHYLGKETVQNLLVTRFSNSIFEPLWNRNFIHHVEISAAENVGIENRAGYYEQSGALRDMIQNHLLNLVGMVAMEPPVDLRPESIRNETIKVFTSFRKFTTESVRENIIRGQYVRSTIQGKTIPGYREEPGVENNSRTETYVALKFFIDNWRWSGVPFYIRTGKYLPTRVTEIVIHFKSTPHYLFVDKKNHVDKDNILVFRIQPDEGILLKFGIKVPGAGFDVSSVNMNFHYSDLAERSIPEAYERLLLDAFNGDATLYPRNDAVEKAWEFVDPILHEWKVNKKLKIYGYPAGSWGPENADMLIEGKNLTWRYPCKNLEGDGIYSEL